VLEKVMAKEYISADVLHFFQKDAAFRRKHLDYYCSFCYLDYTELLKDYDSILKQKNRYLKQENCNQAMLDIYNKQLVEKGVPLVKIRLEACLELEKCLIKSLRDLSILQFDVLELSYIKKRLETVSLQEYSDKWTAQLALDRDKENFLGYTLSGPHRDDIQLNLDHHDITNFSSRGINRILALLFKLSSMDSIKEKLSVKSCLLLDDTLAEIDDDNKEKLLSYMLRYDQVFYATTESNDFSYFNDACLYHVHNGELSLCLS
jgi:DNA replication and repair protein RecF